MQNGSCILGDLGGDIIFKSNLHKKDLSPYFKTLDVFLQKILQAWSSIIYEAKNSSKKQLLSQNYLFRVNNKPIHYIAWSSREKQNISHLMENETRFLSFSVFKERYNIKTSLLSFCGVISAIKHFVININENDSQENTNYEIFLDKFLKAKNPNSLAYKTTYRNETKAAR